MATFERLENNEVKFDIQVNAQTFDDALAGAYRQLRGRYSIPGFRKGKAPRKMIENQYGEGVFYEYAFDSVYWDAYVAAFEEAGVTPVDSPSLKIEDIGRGKDLLFSATVAIKPEITVEDSAYQGIELERVEYTVSDTEVEEKIDSERQRLVRYVEVDRAIKNGDQVNLDYSGTVDDIAFAGGTAEAQTLDIGSGRFIPGFEEQLIGMQKGEEKNISVTFPEEYHAEDLAGKQAVFAVKINEIKQKELPELDDEFAKDVSDFDTLEEYKQDIRHNLEEEAFERSQNALRDSAIRVVVRNVPFDLPQVMVERQIDRSMEDMRYRLSASGFDLESFYSIIGSSEAQERAKMRDEAEMRVRSNIVLEAIVKKDEIIPNEQDMEKEIDTLAQNMKKSAEEIRSMLTESDMESLEMEVAANIALDRILESATLIEPKIKDEDAQMGEDDAAQESLD